MAGAGLMRSNRITMTDMVAELDRWHLVTIVKIEIDGFLDTRAFDDIVILLRDAIFALGLGVRVSVNEFSSEGINLVIGANVIDRMPSERRPTIPLNSVILNLEQVSVDSQWMSENYIALLQSYPVWDYSSRNLDNLRNDFQVRRGTLLSVGYSQSLTRIRSASTQDIDVLFYGMLSPRRATVLEQLRQTGANIQVLEGIYGEERDHFIARAKIILNLHLSEFPGVAEIVRLSFLLSNHKAIVSECNDTTAMESEIRCCVFPAQYSEIVNACRYLLTNEQQRKTLEQVGFDIFSKRNQVEYVREAIVSTKW
jgi:hypothetical protein